MTKPTLRSDHLLQPRSNEFVYCFVSEPASCRAGAASRRDSALTGLLQVGTPRRGRSQRVKTTYTIIKPTAQTQLGIFESRHIRLEFTQIGVDRPVILSALSGRGEKSTARAQPNCLRGLRAVDLVRWTLRATRIIIVCTL